MSAIARHGTGIRADLRAMGSQVHPVFMLPPLAASLFGAVLAGRFVPWLALLHASAIFVAVYTAHLKDGYVDFHRRGEDDDHRITHSGCRVLLGASSIAFFTLLAGIWWAIDATAALLTLPTWLIAIAHAPQLDTNPVGATVGYPAGIALAIIGGYYLQLGTVDPIAIAFALVFLLLLSGVKIIDDMQDYDYDRSITKRTVAVSIGPSQARRLALSLMLASLFGVVAFAGIGLFPQGTVFAPLAFGLVLYTARRAGAEVATMLLIRGSYVFLAVLVAAVWFRPIAS